MRSALGEGRARGATREGGAMHSVAFHLKRTYLSWIHKAALPAARSYGLTPARFDMLYALEQFNGASSQKEIQGMLSVCKATVSKMLTSLQELGLIVRKVNPFDRRKRIVTLTEKARAWMKLAVEEIMTSGVATAVLGYMFANRGEDEFEALVRVEERFMRALEQLWDRPWLKYYWHPDD